VLPAFSPHPVCCHQMAGLRLFRIFAEVRRTMVQPRGFAVVEKVWWRSTGRIDGGYAGRTAACRSSSMESGPAL
jgi:hypothetical protein